ncbi:MAG: hypothetical protein RMM08_05565 [Armatimonadota bacterium]|nr:hypothetical protein [bacterium]MDW8320810.1 hypothetical protein [Armatimonadota bacterium]
MRLVILLLATILLPTVAFAHEEDGRHHEPRHWESAEMRHELLAQLGGMAALGMVVGGYLLIRRRGNV